MIHLDRFEKNRRRGLERRGAQKMTLTIVFLRTNELPRLLPNKKVCTNPKGRLLLERLGAVSVRAGSPIRHIQQIQKHTIQTEGERGKIRPDTQDRKTRINRKRY